MCWNIEVWAVQKHVNIVDFVKIFPTNIFWNIEVWAVQKHVNLVDLVESFPTNIFLQNLASIQKRTSPINFAYLAEESENGSISNRSTKALTAWSAPAAAIAAVATHPLLTERHQVAPAKLEPNETMDPTNVQILEQ